MTDLKAVPTPHISDFLLNKINAFARPKRMTSSDTMFDAGYEQCKVDLLGFLAATLGQPTPHQAQVNEEKLRKEGPGTPGLLARFLNR